MNVLIPREREQNLKSQISMSTPVYNKQKDDQCFLKVTEITTVALLRSGNSDHIMKWKNVGEVELGPYT